MKAPGLESNGPAIKKEELSLPSTAFAPGGKEGLEVAF
jgi:hypothetical protein